MGPIHIVFGERPFAYCIYKDDNGNFVAGLGSACLGSYREWGPAFAELSQQQPENQKQ